MTFSIKNLRKSYGAADVLCGINLDVREGEIHALLGANGAGKSTLIKCLSGEVAPTSGTIEINGTPFAAVRPRDARAAGIAVVHQEMTAALSLNVCDNIFLGNELRRGIFVRRRAQMAEARRWLADLGIDINPAAELADLGNAELQIIEIIKAMRTKPSLLVLDEPTAALSEREAQRLGTHLLRLRAQNLPMLYVTHRLSEVFALADRVSVLRGGHIVLSGPTRDFTPEQVVNAIVGDTVSRRRDVALPTRPAPVLSVRDLTAHRLGPVTLTANRGEIVGLFGLVGSGRTELLETLFGAMRRGRGEMHLQDARYAPGSVADAVLAGVALVPSDRLRKSIITGLGAADNMLMPVLGLLARAGLRQPHKELAVFSAEAARLDLRPCDPRLEARRFSGGNQQKLVIGRWLNGLHDLHLLLLDEPTQGVDVGARKDIYDALRAFARDRNAAIIVASSEPEELCQIAHRVLVLADGRIAGELVGDHVTEAAMMALAYASDADAAA